MNLKDWTVCVLEPNKFEGQIIVDLLRNAGVDKVRAFTDVEAATEVLEIYNANIVIASFEMTDGDAATWTRVFRRNKKMANRRAAVFVTSGAFSLSMAEQCRHAGANALIGKPISAKVLLATIKKVLSNPRPFIEAEGYVGPCRRAGIVTAGAPQKRRKADAGKSNADAPTLESIVEALAATAGAYAADPRKLDPCEAALRRVQAYAVNAGDGPLMRACAAFTLRLSARNLSAAAAKTSIQACIHGVVQLATMDVKQASAREALAEDVRQAVGKAVMQRAA